MRPVMDCFSMVPETGALRSTSGPLWAIRVPVARSAFTTLSSAQLRPTALTRLRGTSVAVPPLLPASLIPIGPGTPVNAGPLRPTAVAMPIVTLERTTVITLTVIALERTTLIALTVKSSGPLPRVAAVTTTAVTAVTELTPPIV